MKETKTKIGKLICILIYLPRYSFPFTVDERTTNKAIQFITFVVYILTYGLQPPSCNPPPLPVGKIHLLLYYCGSMEALLCREARAVLHITVNRT